MPHAEANGISLYYELHGQGPPLVLVEGIGYSSWMWFRQVDPLGKHHQLITYDNRDVGRSDRLDGSSGYTIRDLADDLVGLLDVLSIDRAHVLGVSMGGFIAQEFALTRPERLRRLMLVGTAFGGPTMVQVPKETRKSMVPDLSLPPEQRIRKAMASAFATGYMEAHPDVIDAIVDMRLSALQQADAWARQAEAISTFDASARVGSIQAPTLIVHGDQDRVVPVENAYLLAQQLPSADLRILPGGGHLAFIEQAERFNQAVLDFLR